MSVNVEHPLHNNIEGEENKPSKRKKAQMALMFFTEKRDKSVKGRMVYAGKPTREWLSHEDAASPTAALESIMITGVIEAKEGRDMMTCNIPNSFIQALLPKIDPREDRVVMEITGVLVDMLFDIKQELYGTQPWYWRTDRKSYTLIGSPIH
jgi:hypothetical protein